MKFTYRTTIVAVATFIVIMTTMTSVGAFAATPRLSSELLTASQMPKGWSADSLSGSVSAGCLTNIVGLTSVLDARGVKQTSSAEVLFVDHSAVPAVSEMLATYSSPVTAYARIVAELSSCKHVSGQAFGMTVTATMSRANFTHYADASQGFAATSLVEGERFNEDLVVVRKGDVVAGVIEGNVPPVNVRQFEGFVVKALAKVR